MLSAEAVCRAVLLEATSDLRWCMNRAFGKVSSHFACRATTELGGDAASEGRDGATIVGWLVPVRWFERSMSTSSTRARRHKSPKARYLSEAKFSIGSETSRICADAQV